MSWKPEFIDYDWMLLSKEEFLKKYPKEDPRLYHPSPGKSDCVWSKEMTELMMGYAVDNDFVGHFKEWEERKVKFRM